MGVTRRYWGEAGLVVALAGLAAAFARPLLLVGAAGVAGWLLARQYVFVQTVSRVADDLSVDQSLDREAVRTDDEVRVVLRAELSEPAPVSLAVEADPPVGVETVGDGESDPAEQGRLTIPAGERSAATTFRVEVALAGEFEFDRPRVTATDDAGQSDDDGHSGDATGRSRNDAGRFRVTFPHGERARLTVTPRGPRNLHVGAGGEAIDAPYGEYESDERGVGIDLAEIRAYVPGDAVRQIDWNATARLGEPHVREFETTTERTTALVLDRRASMATGPAGETKSDYLRQVALGVVAYARRQSEPVSLYEVGAEGLLARHPTTANPQGYARLERRLRAVEPEDGGDSADGRGDRRERVQSPAVARQRSLALGDDSTPFADRLRPFFADADPYVERVADDPLYGVVRTALDESGDAVTAVVLTDDSHRAETREVAKLATRHADRVLAFLAPTALFDERDAELESTYADYADFERFRRDLAGVGAVSAFEVGPGDRLDALLAAGESRYRRARAGESR